MKVRAALVILENFQGCSSMVTVAFAACAPVNVKWYTAARPAALPG
jgi:hypothetical protein